MRRCSLIPDESRVIPVGLLKVADVAAPPSPVKVVVPVPAIVDMIPVDNVTLRMRLLLESATYTLPTDCGSKNPRYKHEQ